MMFLILAASIVLSGCASGRSIGGSSKNCGCGMHKGMVGY
jgi:hypothetical protein